MYSWDFSFVWALLPLLGKGALVTLQLWAIAMVAGLLIGLVVGVLRASPSAVLRAFGTAYVELIRNVPGLVQIFWFFYAVPVLTGWQSSPFMASAVSLSLYTGAYAAEVYRAGIESIDRGQWEGARALGFGYLGQMRYVVLPQALRRMIPALGNRAIELAKATTLASTVAVAELLYTAKTIAEDQLRPLETYTVLAVLFTLMLLPVSYAFARLDRRYSGRETH